MNALKLATHAVSLGCAREHSIQPARPTPGIQDDVEQVLDAAFA